MIRTEKCLVVIPCFNEGDYLFSLVSRVRLHLPMVLVVDDGSTDSTPIQATKSGARLLQHNKNLGKGAAIKTGLGYALGEKFEWVLTLDGDGQHEPEEIPKFLACAEATQASLIIGNRMEFAAKMSKTRFWVNRCMSRLLSIRCGQTLPDSQCGFRLLRLEDWAKLKFRTNHFEIESEMVVRFAQAGLKIAFVPVQPLPQTRPSRIRPALDTWRWLAWWLGHN
jgi:glycosyltransferase involved in cell wall biosynthesis